jgi:hypothetical protein
MVRETTIRTTVLIGAGGSCFANLPTVHSFFERVDWPPSAGLKAACQEIARRIAILEKTNDNANWPHFDAEKIFGYLELMEKVARFNARDMGLHIPNSQPVPEDEIMSMLKREIVRIYGARIEPSVLSDAPHRSLMPMLDKIHPATESIQIFTTNYDPVLEQVFEESDIASMPTGRKVRVCTGFSSARIRRWQPALFSEAPTDGERLVQLVKLHGSATWKMDASGLIDTSWGMPTGYDCLLYFGYKSIPEVEPFITLHTLLKAALMRCQAVVAIGFRFGDPYIRELFDFALRANSSLRVIYSLTGPPDANSPLAGLMRDFPGRVVLLADALGGAIKFGDPNFSETLRKTLTNSSQSGAVA